MTLKIHCGCCGTSWSIGLNDNIHGKLSATCPTCGQRVSQSEWELKLLPVFLIAEDIDRQLSKNTDENGQPFYNFEIVKG